MKTLSTRTHFVVAVVLTLVLLLGSTILQQIVFKADQELSSLIISPPTFRATAGESLDFEIVSRSGDTVFATGLEAEITFDRAQLTFVEALPVTGWQTLQIETSEDRLRWLLSPLTAESPVAPINGSSVLGRIRFQATAAGVATLGLDRGATILSAADPASGNFIYNAASSVQNSAGTIASIDGDTPFPETDMATLTAPVTTAQPLFGSQRIVGTFAAAGANDALIFVTLGYPGKASVEFGATPRLGNRVESLSQNTHHVLRLAGLQSETQYYYRVIGEQAGEQSEVVGQVRAVTLPPVSTVGTVSAVNSEVIAFPNRADRETSVYIFPRDEAGGAVAAAEIQLNELAGIVPSAIKRHADYAQFDLTRSAEKKVAITVQPKVGDVQLARSSAVLDPNYAEPSRFAATRELVLSWNNKTAAVLFGGAILLFILGLLFVRLVRSR